MRLFLALVTNILFAAAALAAAPVWEVRKDASVAWLGGTSHLLRASDYPLPAAFERAYGQAGTVVFETDIGALSSPEAQRKIMAELVYADGRTLQDTLSPAAWQALVRYCEEAGIPVAALRPLKPAGVALTLIGLELQKIGADRRGVDQFYYDQAKEDGKKIVGLETVAAQIGFIATLGKGMEDELIGQSLAELGQTGAMFEKILAAWRQGDEQELLRLLVADMRKDYPDIYRTLLVDRNRRWLPAIEELLATPEAELILVGAAHLVGPDGLIDALRRRGYQVRQLD